MPLTTIKYPYLPEGQTYHYVRVDNEFMAVAKRNMERSGCRKHATSAVAVIDGKIVAEGSNAGTFVTICPRVYKGYGTGQGYRYCIDYCGQQGHAEVMVVRDAKEKGVDLTGADVYLYGHWWACQKCWDALLAAKIGRLFVSEGSEQMFNDQAHNPGEFETVDLKVYVSGPLTRLADAKIKTLYEQIGELAQTMGMSAHVPHLHTDPKANADVTPEQVYAFDSGHVKDSDIVVAYVGETSLGVGMELQMALQNHALVVLISEKDKPVSRLVLGSPAVIEHVQFTDHKDALTQLRGVFEKLIKTAKKKNQSTL